MTVVQTGSVRLGVAKQAAAGTLETNPTYLFGVESGGINVAIDQAPDELTSGSRAAATVYRSGVTNTVDMTGRAHIASTGLMLYGALGSKSVTGSGTYTHIFTLAESLPILSIFEEFGSGGSVVGLRDAKVNELTFSWEANSPLKMTSKLTGTVVSFPSSITATTDETALTTYFTPVSGTFKLDLDGDTLAAASVKGGSISVKNNLTADFYSGSISAGSVSEGKHSVELSLTTVPADLTQWKTVVTGTTTGSGVAATPVYGSFEVTFTSGTASLKLEGSNVAFMCDLPQASAGGGAAEVDLAGVVLLDTYTDKTSCIKATLINSTATY